MHRPHVTIVATVYNEAEGLVHFADVVRKEVSALPYDYTLLFVNDGSTDETREILDRLYENDPDRISVLHLSRNFGHQAALTAGMDYASGDVVITMDSDMQHPPSFIPELLR